MLQQQQRRAAQACAGPVRSEVHTVGRRVPRAYPSNGTCTKRAAPKSQRSRRQHTTRAFTTGEAPVQVETQARRADGKAKQPLTVSWAGAGIFFFWQLGAMKYLAEQYDLTKVPMVGASGGALAAVLAACGVDADKVIELAYSMSCEHNIWEKPLGLMGLWGGFIEQWLDALLPDNAHELCRGRITVVVTTLPDMAQIGITDFKDKKDLINACMASSHVPFFLDFKLTRNCRGRQCVDGSFPDFFTGLNSELLRSPGGGSAVVFDYFDDARLTRRGRMDMLEVKSYEEIKKMFSLGYEYAAALHADGRFAHFELAEVLLQGENGHVSEVLVPEHSGGQPQQPQAAGAKQKAAPAVPQLVLAAAESAAATPAALQRSGNGGPRGLVLELQQTERELQERLRQGAGQQAIRRESPSPSPAHAA